MDVCKHKYVGTFVLFYFGKSYILRDYTVCLDSLVIIYEESEIKMFCTIESWGFSKPNSFSCAILIVQFTEMQNVLQGVILAATHVNRSFTS